MLERRADIDWLRVLAMLAMVLRHSARMFNYGGWVITNGRMDLGLTLFVTFTDQWIMPLFFVLSGMSAFYALERQTSIQYSWGRFKRLGIPLLLGILALIPPQWYLMSISKSRFDEPYPAFLLQFVKNINLQDLGSLAHLWYLEVLLIFCIVTLPVFRLLRRDIPRRAVGELARWARRPGLVLLFALPLIGAEIFVALPGRVPQTYGTWNLLTYAVFFGLGYLIASDTRFKAAVERHARVALLLATFILSLGFSEFLSPSFFLRFPPALRAIDTWLWIVAILGFGGQHLSFRNRFLDYATTAVLPFYILHQTVIVLVGFAIVDWNLPVLLKYAFVSTCSFIVILIVYHLLIRRIGILRFLFGLKLTPPTREALAT